MPFTCRIRKSFYGVVFSLFCLSVCVFIVIAFVFLIRRQIQKRKEERREVNQLAQDIISLMQHHASACETDTSLQPYVPISHVRDALIPIADRKKKRHLWNKAVALLSTSESRVRLEVKKVNGEECDVWSWLDIASDPLKQFDRSNKVMMSTNLESKPSSAFLKVNNLLSGAKGTNGTVDSAIRDAVLDRCGPYHGILHIDSYEDCVYLKCVSEAAAGQVFKFIHGWSYDGKFVSVRYVTPLLYRTLFPASVDAMVPLRTSSYKRRSALLLGTDSRAGL